MIKAKLSGLVVQYKTRSSVKQQPLSMSWLFTSIWLFYKIRSFIIHYLQYFCILVVSWEVGLRYGIWGLLVVALGIALTPEKFKNIIWFAREKQMAEMSSSSKVNLPHVNWSGFINQVIHQLWPLVTIYMENCLRNTVEPKINEYLERWKILTFKFKMNGVLPDVPYVEDVRVYSTFISGDILLEVHFRYTGNFPFSAIIARVEWGGNAHIQITGKIKIILKHLLPHPPFVRHVCIVPVSPDVTFNFTGIACFLPDSIHKKLIDTVKEAWPEEPYDIPVV
ncbi:extended synaptotagmin-3 isoform X1 [Cherax quadricarinatus]